MKRENGGECQLRVDWFAGWQVKECVDLRSGSWKRERRVNGDCRRGRSENSD